MTQAIVFRGVSPLMVMNKYIDWLEQNNVDVKLITIAENKKQLNLSQILQPENIIDNTQEFVGKMQQDSDWYLCITYIKKQNQNEKAK